MLRYVNIFFKRIMDILGSLLGIILLSPFFIIISIAIKIDSKGPVFFIQERLGKNGKVFKILKFRTMVVNAAKLGDGIKLTKNDARITRFGRFLRKFSIDETPQIFNVLFGKMSIIGPRPLLIDHPKPIDEYTDKEKVRFMMKPGITGLAQVSGRGKISWDEKFNFDHIYVQKFNLFLDFVIFLKTIKVVLFPKNLYKDE